MSDIDTCKTIALRICQCRKVIEDLLSSKVTESQSRLSANGSTNKGKKIIALSSCRCTFLIGKGSHSMFGCHCQTPMMPMLTFLR